MSFIPHTGRWSTPDDQPSKRPKLLSDDSSDDKSSDASGGVALTDGNDPCELTINKDYARKFEYNQKRAELHRLEEKFGPARTRPQPKNSVTGAGEVLQDDEDDSSSDEEEEDDDGILASGALDEEVNATLNAIRIKDPRVYDTNSVFYTATNEEEGSDNSASIHKEKPMYLHDYHRENLLRGATGSGDEAPQPTYAQHQQELKESIVREMHAAANGFEDDSISDNGNASFLVAKQRVAADSETHGPKVVISAIDIESAEKDPDQFLSKFLESRAWVQASSTSLHPFESDDDDEDERAEAFEEAYNLRFENPDGANEKLVSHSRGTAVRYSVRHETTNKRKRAREAEQARKAEERDERQEEKALLRKLRIEEAEEKVKKIKEAAGLGKRAVKIEDWQNILTEDWDDQRWETEMKNKFGEDYYDNNSPSESVDEGANNKKSKKPKWNDDIDITDLVPDFDDKEVKFSLSSDEDVNKGDKSRVDPSDGKQRRKFRDEMKKEARRERLKLEQLVDEKLDTDIALNGDVKTTNASRFKYRETSPIAYGLTAQDILMASDGQLNQFAGLKKMATYRDPEKKRKDKKHLGKKARLRQWRKETFGNEQGPQKTIQDLLREEMTKDQEQPVERSHQTGGERFANDRLPKRLRKLSGKTAVKSQG